MLKKTVQILVATLLGAGFFLVWAIMLLQWFNPPFTAFTLQADWGEHEQQFYSLRENWVPPDDIPEHMVWAVVASEDQLFFEHHGFDFESMEEAWEEHQEGVRTRGASTISQQVAKNLFLTPAQSFLRKGIEAGITVLIELFWTKERIIEVYLNIVEFGPGVYGIGKASDVYYNRPVTQLTPTMAARFAAVLPSPKRMRVNPPSPYTQERSQWILRQMNQLTGKVFYAFENDTTTNQPENSQPDSTTADTSTTISHADSFDVNIAPDTLIREFPDTTLSPSDTSDSTQTQ
ncbi:MAG: monofunctional biosynthetic peptidoglycan transglycosylase [Balneolaceae bacterium]|nr:monofunctional biosynthetic peptidoglycan transglycosylase [Balneolaceae bacterium]